MSTAAIRRVGMLIFLSILFITINMFVIMMFDKLIGQDYGSWWYAFSIGVLMISAVGSLYAVFMVYNYKDTNKEEDTTEPKIGFLPEKSGGIRLSKKRVRR